MFPKQFCSTACISHKFMNEESSPWTQGAPRRTVGQTLSSDHLHQWPEPLKHVNQPTVLRLRVMRIVPWGQHGHPQRPTHMGSSVL